jgi:hypothetical protein
MEGIWPIIFLAVVLKIPVLFAFWLVWWASRSYDEFAEDEASPDPPEHGFRRWRREPKPPGGPRRGGPHGGNAVPLPDCPPDSRTRTPAVKPRVAPGVAAHERR